MRFDPDNAIALCYGCHIRMGSFPNEHTKLFEKRLGEKGLMDLEIRANTIKKKRDFINSHFKNELTLMLEDE